MRKIHADNGKDFRSASLKASCDEYGIDIQWRPVRTPHFGGHIERLMGTLMGRVHVNNHQAQGIFCQHINPLNLCNGPAQGPFVLGLRQGRGGRCGLPQSAQLLNRMARGLGGGLKQTWVGAPVPGVVRGGLCGEVGGEALA